MGQPVSQHWLVANSRSSVSKWWKNGAGIVTLRGLRGSSRADDPTVQVCLVSGKNGRLGFPKGARKGLETPLECAQREWCEESSLPLGPLRVLSGRVLVEAEYGCHYMISTWEPDEAENVAESSWAPLAEDPSDPNPIVKVQWMSVHKALLHPDLTVARKELLKHALHSVMLQGTMSLPVV